MQPTDVRKIFGGSCRINWLRAENENWEISVRMYASLQELIADKKLFLTWTVDGASGEGGRAIRIDEMPGAINHLGYAWRKRIVGIADKMFEDGTSIVHIVALALTDGKRIIIVDGNHRVCAATLFGMDVRTALFVMQPKSALWKVEDYVGQQEAT